MSFSSFAEFFFLLSFFFLSLCAFLFVLFFLLFDLLKIPLDNVSHMHEDASGMPWFSPSCSEWLFGFVFSLLLCSVCSHLSLWCDVLPNDSCSIRTYLLSLVLSSTRAWAKKKRKSPFFFSPLRSNEFFRAGWCFVALQHACSGCIIILFQRGSKSKAGEEFFFCFLLSLCKTLCNRVVQIRCTSHLMPWGVEKQQEEQTY